MAAAQAQDAAAAAETVADTARADAATLAQRLAAAEELLGEVSAPLLLLSPVPPAWLSGENAAMHRLQSSFMSSFMRWFGGLPSLGQTPGRSDCFKICCGCNQLMAIPYHNRTA